MRTICFADETTAILAETESNEPVQGTQAIEREARLLVAGDYPDKGISITEADLERIASEASQVPVLAEHKPSLVLGFLQSAWRVGKELWGKLRFLPTAHALIEHLNLRGVSVGLKRDPLRLAEVSITATPRIREAQLFHDEANEPAFETHALYLLQEERNMEQLHTETAHETREQFTETNAAQGDDTLKREMERLREELARTREIAQYAREKLFEQSLETRVGEWQREGRLTPASANALRKLVFALRDAIADPVVEFTQESNPVIEQLIEFVNSLPKQPVKAQPVRYIAPVEDTRVALEQELRKLGFTTPLTNDAVEAFSACKGGDAL